MLMLVLGLLTVLHNPSAAVQLSDSATMQSPNHALTTQFLPGTFADPSFGPQRPLCPDPDTPCQCPYGPNGSGGCSCPTGEPGCPGFALPTFHPRDALIQRKHTDWVEHLEH